MMKIVEFCGLPGCGKSTLCEAYIKSLPQSMRVYRYRDIVRFISTRARRNIYLPLVHLNPFRWHFLYLLYQFSKQYPNVSKNALYVLIALFDISSSLSVFQKNAVMILDEGFVQNLTSIPHLSQLQETDEFLCLVNYVKKKTNLTLVCCSADPELVIRRLRKRNRGDRFNSIADDNALQSALSIKSRNITAITRYFQNNITICTNEELSILVGELCKKIDNI